MSFLNISIFEFGLYSILEKISKVKNMRQLNILNKILYQYIYKHINNVFRLINLKL